MRKSTWLLLATLALTLVACGGGSSGTASPSATATPSLSVSPSSLTVNATTTGSAPSSVIQMSVTNLPSAGLYASGNYSTNGIASVSLTNVGSVEDATIIFKPPGSLGVGTYTDVVSLGACYDQACTKPIANSPQQVLVTYVVTLGNPATATPVISSLSPISIAAGSGSFTLAITGGDFATGSVVLWNGAARSTTFVSATSLLAQIAASDVASVGTASVSVSNASTGGGVSPPIAFTITAPGPSLSTLAPASTSAGAPAFTLTLTGSGFDSTAQVYWNGSARSTSFASATQVTAQITAADVLAAGTNLVTVTNLDNPGTSSAAVSFTVNNAPLSLTSVSPTTVTAGSALFTLSVLGTGFDSGAIVQWNGSARTTTLVSSTELLAQITAADVASVGTASVTVVSTGASPGTTTAASVAIVAQSVDATSFLVNPQHTSAITFANLVASSALPSTPTWTTSLGGAPTYPIIAGGRVFVTVALSTGTSELLALNAADGTPLWGPIALSGSAVAAYDNGAVFVLSASPSMLAGQLSAYDAATGSLRWSVAITSQYSFTGPPTASNGYVYLGGAGSGGTLYAFKETNGALTWTAAVANGDNSAPSVTADGVYVSYPCQTYDFRPLTGELIWNNSAGCEGGGGATGAAANGVYYSPNGASGFSGQSFNAQTGAVMTSYSATVPPAFGAQTGYFLQSGTLRGITLSNNTILWSFAGDGTLAMPPLLVNNYVFVQGSSGNLYALDATTGAQLWQVAAGTPPAFNAWFTLQTSAMSAGDGLLLVPTTTGLIAYTLSTNP